MVEDIQPVGAGVMGPELAVCAPSWHQFEHPLAEETSLCFSIATVRYEPGNDGLVFRSLSDGFQAAIQFRGISAPPIKSGFRKTLPDTSPPSSFGQTARQSHAANRLVASDPTSAPFVLPCNRSSIFVSSATLPLPARRIVCCIDQLNPQPFAVIGVSAETISSPCSRLIC